MYLSKLLLVSQSTYLQMVSYQRSITAFVSASLLKVYIILIIDDIMRKQ